MLGLMQDWPLLIQRIIDHAAINHGDQPVITRSIEGPIHRTNYREPRARALQVAQRSTRRHQDRRSRRDTRLEHLAPSGSLVRHHRHGRIYHTVNPRLFPEQIVWIINHAEDRMTVDRPTFMPLLEKIADKLPTIEQFIVSPIQPICRRPR